MPLIYKRLPPDVTAWNQRWPSSYIAYDPYLYKNQAPAAAPLLRGDYPGYVRPQLAADAPTFPATTTPPAAPASPLKTLAIVLGGVALVGLIAYLLASTFYKPRPIRSNPPSWQTKKRRRLSRVAKRRVRDEFGRFI